MTLAVTTDFLRRFPLHTRRSLVLQDFAFTILSYALFDMYARDIIGTAAYIALSLCYFLRTFNIRHGKMHANNAIGLKPRWLDRLADYVQILYLPYHEPYAGKWRKHLAHHQAHHRAKDAIIKDIAANPHYVFERQPMLRALIAAIFYEEVMLIHDVKHGQVGWDRVIMALLGSLSIAWMIAVGGLGKFFVFALLYRVCFSLSWFSFSYLTHRDDLFVTDFDTKIPRPVRETLSFLYGRGAFNSTFYHRMHHLFPNVPAESLHHVNAKFYGFDEPAQRPLAGRLAAVSGGE